MKQTIMDIYEFFFGIQIAGVPSDQRKKLSHEVSFSNDMHYNTWQIPDVLIMFASYITLTGSIRLIVCQYGSSQKGHI